MRLPANQITLKSHTGEPAVKSVPSRSFTKEQASCLLRDLVSRLDKLNLHLKKVTYKMNTVWSVLRLCTALFAACQSGNLKVLIMSISKKVTHPQIELRQGRAAVSRHMRRSYVAVKDRYLVAAFAHITLHFRDAWSVIQLVLNFHLYPNTFIFSRHLAKRFLNKCGGRLEVVTGIGSSCKGLTDSKKNKFFVVETKRMKERKKERKGIREI